LKERLAAVKDRVDAEGWEAAVVVNDEGVVLGCCGRGSSQTNLG
jgi:hypothetical protein